MRIKQGIQALRIAVKQWRIAAIVYVLQFGLALTLGMQVRDVLKASIGNSLSVNKLTSGYDHTVLMDFLKTHGASITPLIGQLLWFIPVWIIFSVLINGGLLYCSTKPAEASGSVFWKAGAQYFFPFLKISLLHWGFLLVWTGVSLLPAILTLSAALQYFSSEQYAVLIVCSVAVVWLSGVGIILTASTSSRLRYMEDHTGSIGKCFSTRI